MESLTTTEFTWPDRWAPVVLVGFLRRRLCRRPDGLASHGTETGSLHDCTIDQDRLTHDGLAQDLHALLTHAEVLSSVLSRKRWFGFRFRGDGETHRRILANRVQRFFMATLPDVREDIRTCTICLNTASEGSLKALRCGHAFHEKCLLQLILTKGAQLVCPVCRHPFRPLRPISEWPLTEVPLGIRREARQLRALKVQLRNVQSRICPAARDFQKEYLDAMYMLFAKIEDCMIGLLTGNAAA
eukprot:TRINITY_DN11489_c0_g2_i2.p1 TRINITY_DN11489_c0_g2~~TRINITY_DN11489_c0_g2_i2.p1  ORF type:complete len:243 (-),score=21.32 TRINITY_DN11489_c0_g2_i2:106-834(-)